MTRSTKATKTVAADPAALLMAALQQTAAEQPQRSASRRTTSTQREQLAQPLTDRDRAALARMGWNGRLSSPKPAEPKPRAAVKCGPVVNVATFSDLTPERQASTQFWAGLCSTLARSNGRVWLPEAAAVACQLGVEITGPSQLAARLTAITGLPVTRPVDAAGWITCDISEPMPAAQVWAQLWSAHLQAFSDVVASEGSAG